eukprot:755226-Hanusia_phi.AAC.1
MAVSSSRGAMREPVEGREMEMEEHENERRGEERSRNRRKIIGRRGCRSKSMRRFEKNTE